MSLLKKKQIESPLCPKGSGKLGKQMYRAALARVIIIVSTSLANQIGLIFSVLIAWAKITPCYDLV